MAECVPEPTVNAASQCLLDLAQEPLCWIDHEGMLHPVNACMQSLLDAIGKASGRRPVFLHELPLDEDDRESLRLLLQSQEPAHECVLRLELPRYTRILRARFLRNEQHGGYYLALQDETRLRLAEARVLRLERLHCLGALCSGVVHDVDNVLGAILGFAAHLASVSRDPDEKAFLDSIRRGAKEGANLVHTVSQLVRSTSSQRKRISFRQLVEDSLQMFRKTAVLQGTDLQCELAADLPQVRVVPEETLQAIVQLLLYSRSSVRAGSPIVVRALREQVPGPRPNLPSRHYAVLQIVDLGDAMEAQALRDMLDQPEAGLALHMGKLSGDATGLLVGMLSVLFAGGRFACEGPTQGRRIMSLRLPAARARDAR